ncbi:MAG: tRNA lysidine(34) synthetase TilS [Anaerolineales bacterium]
MRLSGAMRGSQLVPSGHLRTPEQVERRVLDVLKRTGVHSDAPVLVGVSGGPDSLCLLECLHRLAVPLLVVHFNHGLRPEADKEARAVEAEAHRLSQPFLEGKADVGAEARGRGISIEVAGRDCRYAFFFEQARSHGAQAILVGHTADDQAETVLMHLLRGAGIRGLAGMSYRTILRSFDPAIPVVRPLLDVWREESLAYCESRGLHPQYDASNDSTVFLRNRVRRHLIPVLEEYNPQIRLVLCRMAESIASDREALDDLSRLQLEGIVLRKSTDYVALDVKRLAELSEAGVRQAMRALLEDLAPTQDITYLQLTRAVEVTQNPGRRVARLAGGITLSREAGVIYASRGDSSLPLDAWPQLPADRDSISIEIPGKIPLASGWSFATQPEVEVGQTEPGVAWVNDPFRARLDADRLPARLELRIRRRGDRFKPLGLGGHSQKLSDFFINEKMPARARSRWPLMCGGDAVVWIPGFRPAEDFRLKPETRRVTEFVVRRAA